MVPGILPTWEFVNMPNLLLTCLPSASLLASHSESPALQPQTTKVCCSQSVAVHCMHSFTLYVHTCMNFKGTKSCNRNYSKNASNHSYVQQFCTWASHGQSSHEHPLRLSNIYTPVTKASNSKGALHQELKLWKAGPTGITAQCCTPLLYLKQFAEPSLTFLASRRWSEEKQDGAALQARLTHQIIKRPAAAM